MVDQRQEHSGYQLYRKYSMWSACNQQYWLSIPAFQELNRYPIFVDLTHDDRPETPPQSPQSSTPPQLHPMPPTYQRRSQNSSPVPFTPPPKLQRHPQSPKAATPKQGPNSPTLARDFKVVCEKCQRAFTSRKRLQNHMTRCLVEKEKASLKPFACRECSRRFMKRAGLAKHTEKFHPEMVAARAKAEVQFYPEPSRSIFHSINLLAESDCNSKARQWKGANVIWTCLQPMEICNWKCS